MIQIDDYLIEICRYTGLYDLYKVGKTKTGKYVGRETKRDLAYGITMERAIQRIIQDKLRLDKEVKGLDTFIESYKEVSEDVLSKFSKEIERINK